MDEIKDLKAEKARLEKRVRHLEYLLDGAERKAERRRKHIERIEEACHDLRRRNSMLGDRLMPEGMEWPRYDSGEPVRIGDEYIDHEGLLRKAERIVFIGDGYYLVSRIGTYYLRRYGQRVKRPPVLASDGEPLEKGQTVYLPDSTPLYVTGIGDMTEGHQTVFGKAGNDITDSEWSAALLTHQRPVLDDDGVPIKVGDTVYFTDGREQECNTVVHAKYDYKDEPYVQLGRLNEAGCPTYTNCSCIDPSQLTHTKPEPTDTWERIEKDMGDDMAQQQCGPVSPEVATAHAAEFVRRCKALAGVSE